MFWSAKNTWTFFHLNSFNDEDIFLKFRGNVAQLVSHRLLHSGGWESERQRQDRPGLGRPRPHARPRLWHVQERQPRVLLLNRVQVRSSVLLQMSNVLLLCDAISSLLRQEGTNPESICLKMTSIFVAFQGRPTIWTYLWTDCSVDGDKYCMRDGDVVDES